MGNKYNLSPEELKVLRKNVEDLISDFNKFGSIYLYYYLLVWVYELISIITVNNKNEFSGPSSLKVKYDEGFIFKFSKLRNNLVHQSSKIKLNKVKEFYSKNKTYLNQVMQDCGLELEFPELKDDSRNTVELRKIDAFK